MNHKAKMFVAVRGIAVVALAAVIGFFATACPTDNTDKPSGPPALTGTVTINDTTPEVGDTLTASYTGGNGSGTATWQWLANNAAISGANSNTYEVVAGDLNKTLKARVSYADQSGSVASGATSAVGAKTKADLTGTVTIDNTSPEVGDTLTASYTGGNGSGTATWQWLANNAAINGANSNTYEVVAGDLNKTLKARVSYADQSGSVASDATAAVAAATKPALTGTVTVNNTSPKVGDTLTASYSGGNGSGTATWQWLANDAAINDANGATYEVVAGDLGKKLKARVSYSGQSGSVASGATSAVAAPSTYGPQFIDQPIYTYDRETEEETEYAGTGEAQVITAYMFNMDEEEPLGELTTATISADGKLTLQLPAIVPDNLLTVVPNGYGGNGTVKYGLFLFDFDTNIWLTGENDNGLDDTIYIMYFNDSLTIANQAVPAGWNYFTFGENPGDAARVTDISECRWVWYDDLDYNAEREFPYTLDGDTLTFNPMRRGDGTRVYTPEDDKCDKWDLEQGTGGTFPVGKWVSQNTPSDEWFEFKQDDTWKYYYHNESSTTYTLDETNGTFTFTAWGAEYNGLPYTVSGNTLTFNPMQRGDGTTPYTPEDPKCDKWILEGTPGTFPEGKWVNGSEWLEFGDGTMTYFMEWNQTGTYSVDATDATSGVIYLKVGRR